MTEDQELAYLRETRQSDVEAILLALLLIERADYEAANRVLTERLPVRVGDTLKKAKP